MNGRRTPEQVAERHQWIADLAAAGWPPKHIATEVGVSPSTVHRAMQRLNASWAEQIIRRNQRIAALTLTGWTRDQIAAELGICTRTVERARVSCGVAKPHAEPMSDIEIRRAAALLDDGASYGEVARTLRRDQDTIRRHLPGRSIWKVGSGIELRQYRAALDAITPPLRVGVAS